MSTAVHLVNEPTCPICEGTGWKTIEIPGKASRVTRCDCRQKSRNRKLFESCGIPPRYEHCTLADFETDFDGAHRSLSRAKLAAGRFVEEYPIETTGLWFSGPIGVGKTHLAVGIVQELILSKGLPCLFCDYRELLKEIQNSYNPSVQATELEILRPVFETEIVVLDELGAVRPSEWVLDTVGYILNRRYNEKKTTIITTNFPHQSPVTAARDSDRNKSIARPDTLADRITERMLSRLYEMSRLIEMDGIDFRSRVRSANFR